MTVLPLLLAGLMLGSGTFDHGELMTRPEAAAVVSLGPAAATAATAPAARDAWLGEDKARHLSMSFALTMMTVGAARAAGMEARASMSVAAGVTLAAGIGKELEDRRNGRVFSVRDLAFDLLGIGLGLTLASYTR